MAKYSAKRRRKELVKHRTVCSNENLVANSFKVYAVMALLDLQKSFQTEGGLQNRVLTKWSRLVDETAAKTLKCLSIFNLNF